MLIRIPLLGGLQFTGAHVDDFHLPGEAESHARPWNLQSQVGEHQTCSNMNGGTASGLSSPLPEVG